MVFTPPSFPSPHDRTSPGSSGVDLGLTHDLRAPARRITYLAAALQGLLRDGNTRAATECAAAIARQSAELQVLMASLPEGATLVEPANGAEPVDLNRVMTRVILRNGASPKDCAKILPVTLPTIISNTRLIGQLFSALVVHMLVGAAPDAMTITATTTNSHVKLRLAVHSNETEAIVIPAVCQRVMNALTGRIEAGATDGAGGAVVLTFPRAPGGAAVEPAVTATVP